MSDPVSKPLNVQAKLIYFPYRRRRERDTEQTVTAGDPNPQRDVRLPKPVSVELFRTRRYDKVTEGEVTRGYALGSNCRLLG